jgi:hypothetical protein
MYKHLIRRKKWVYDELAEIVNSYNTIKELRIKNYDAYTTIRRHHKELLLKLKRNVR